MLRAALWAALAGVVVASPWNPYKPQDPHYPTAAATVSQLLCHIIPSVNASNIDQLKNDPNFVNELAKYACGNNRGVFVLELPEYANYTYSCMDFPTKWCNGSKTCGWNDILNDNKGQQLIDYLNLWFEGMFNSSIEKHPADCSMDAYGSMSCPTHIKEEPWKNAPWVSYINNQPIRGVNIGGLFVLEPWINRGFANWGNDIRDQLTLSQSANTDPTVKSKLADHWSTWYTQADFDNMKNTMQLNTVRLPVGWWYFADQAGISPGDYIVPDQKLTDPTHPITAVIKMAQKAGLKLILDLHGAPCSQNGLDNSGNKSMEANQDMWGDTWLYTKECMDDSHAVLEVMAEYIVEILPKMGVNDTIIMLELVNEPWVYDDISLVRDFYFYMLNTIRDKTCNGTCPPSYWTYKTLPLLFHDAFRHFPWTWLLRHYDLTNVFMDTHLYHAFNIADIASDSEACDRQKMTITENIACQYDGLLTYKSCTSLPILVGEWSLAIDNCMGMLNGSPDVGRAWNNWNAGQCRPDDLKNRLNTLWWDVHFENFAEKQIYTYERQLGWTFWCYKVDNVAQQDPSSNWWSFSQAFAKGYITVPYDSHTYQGGCSNLEAVPDCVESNTNVTKKVMSLSTDLRNMRGKVWH
eukprot:TRINITY_DN5655_c0_g1_i1.p1 TRINITY_DN5655_c0_g1~~TRINITY_DN5655_c0_g1_i1.p1  ORF type:complete len:635 (+),score=234.61 TRINITY_DN5655_c0_g1_i1:651-2555(+)